MSPARNKAPLVDLAELDLGDLLPPELQQQKRTVSGVFTRPVAPLRSSFMPGPVGTRMPSQPPALVIARPTTRTGALVGVLFGAIGFLLATSVMTYLLYR
ncbi:MAG TPA: hypothetical protein VIF62_23900 [Labilithrix sp.]|jgi:hypothetical protein